MRLYLSHNTALFLIRRQRQYGYLRKDPQRLAFRPEMGNARARSLAMDLPPLRDLPEPVHFMVGRQQRRSGIPGQVWHSVTSTPSARSFTRLQPDIFFATPELCFAQLATCLDLASLIQVGYELCGRYSLPATAGQETVYKVEPASTPRRLQRYLDTNPALAGSKAARRALRYIRPNSYSPMETVLVMLLCLPVMLGGYGCPWPVMNARIEVKDSYGRTRQRFCDLYWPQMKLAFEYDSAAYHQAGEKWLRDSARRVDLGLSRIEVVSVAYAHLVNEAETEELARLIGERSAKHITPRNFAYSAAREQLRYTLLQHP